MTSKPRMTGVGPLADWAGRHWRTLTLLVVLAVMFLIAHHYESHVSANLRGVYKAGIPLLVLAGLLALFERFPEASPEVEWIGSKTHGYESVKAMFPNLADEKIHARLLRLSGGRKRLRWKKRGLGLEHPDVNTAASKLHVQLGVTYHDPAHVHRSKWELIFHKTQPLDATHRPVDLAPEDRS